MKNSIEKRTAFQGLMFALAFLAFAKWVAENAALTLQTVFTIWVVVVVVATIAGLRLYFKKAPQQPKQLLESPTIDGHCINE